MQGPLPRRLPLDRPRVGGRAGGDGLELIPYAPRQEALELQRDSEALLLLIPDAGGRGKGVLSGKVFEYLAAERPILAVVPPDGAAADADPRDRRGRRRAARRRRGDQDRARGAARRFANGRPRLDRDSGGDAPPALAPRPRRGLAEARPLAVNRLPAPGWSSSFSSGLRLHGHFAKLQWEVAGTLSLSDVLTAVFLVALARHSHRHR